MKRRCFAVDVATVRDHRKGLFHVEKRKVAHERPDLVVIAEVETDSLHVRVDVVLLLVGGRLDVLAGAAIAMLEP